MRLILCLLVCASDAGRQTILMGLSLLFLGISPCVAAVCTSHLTGDLCAERLAPVQPVLCARLQWDPVCSCTGTFIQGGLILSSGSSPCREHSGHQTGYTCCLVSPVTVGTLICSSQVNSWRWIPFVVHYRLPQVDRSPVLFLPGRQSFPSRSDVDLRR